MTSGKISRRRFMQSSVAAGVGASLLPSCAMMDRFFGLEKSKLDQEVLVIGAGAAGLMAAYELKKAGIPFRLFEGSGRIGGRVYTLENFDSEGHVAELGAEYFEEDHKLIFDLCKELNLPIDEVKWDRGLEKQLTFSRGKILTTKETNSRLQKLSNELIRIKLHLVGDRNEIITPFNVKDFPQAPAFDQLSVMDLLQSLKDTVDADTLSIFETSCVAQFGRSLNRVSSMHLLNALDLEAKGQKTLFRVRYGNQRLLRTLYDRVASVMPDFFVRLDSPLIEIQEKPNSFQCFFKSPSGNKKFEARQVILALPVNQYKNIEGFQKLQISDAKKESVTKVELGSHTKVVLGYKQKFWLKRQDLILASRGSFFKENLPMITWDGSLAQGGTKGVLAALIGGEACQSLGSGYAEQIIKELQVFSRSFKNEFENNSHLMDWKKKPFSEGSYVIYGPGDFLKYHGLWSESDYGGRLAYAGEHCHLTRFGTLSGALESGRQAAANMIESRKGQSPKS